jgi:hypothetical protein
MKKVFAIALLSVALTGCYKDPQATTTEGMGIQVDFLFEKDGIKVYRFNDGGGYHYFTSKGETMTTKSTGKTNYQENIQ